METANKTDDFLESRPGIFMIGSSNVGKRTLLSRLLGVDFEDGPESNDVMAHGWTIDTKYYTADVSIWMAHLQDGFDISSLPIYDKLAALVMVFDMSELSSLNAIQTWVSNNDIRNFDILLCIGNKVDLIPGHPVHVEYRRRLQKLGNASARSYAEIDDSGISETEGSNLLGNEEPSWEIGRSCLEWCSELGIEYMEACASNADFDKCLSVDGDSQGLERLIGALSAHMWPGMILKSGDKISKPSLPENEELSEEESEYELEYEILSAGSAEPWDDIDGGWVTASSTLATQNIPVSIVDNENGVNHDKKDSTNSESEMASADNTDNAGISTTEELGENPDPGTEAYDFEDLEQLMFEIGNIRENLRLMPDFQRREMAAKVAMKMASMFGGGSDEEE